MKNYKDKLKIISYTIDEDEIGDICFTYGKFTYNNVLYKFSYLRLENDIYFGKFPDNKHVDFDQLDCELIFMTIDTKDKVLIFKIIGE